MYAGEILSVVGREGSGREALRDRLLDIFPAPMDETGTFVIGDKGSAVPRIAYLPGASRDAWSPYASARDQLVRILARRQSIPMQSAREELRLVLARLPNAPSLEMLEAKPTELSPRDQALAFLALALAQNPDLLLADDPDSELDPTDSLEYVALLAAERARANCALLYLTGNPAIAARFGGRIAVLRDGRLIEEGAARRLSSEHAHAYTQTLFAAVPRVKPDEPARPGPRSEPLLQVRGFSFEKAKNRAYDPTRTLTFELRRGGSLALVGMRNSGRHDLVRAILGLEEAGQGRIIFDSVDVGVLSSTMRARLRQRVAFVTGDDAPLDPRMTVREFVTEPMRAQINLGREANRRAAETVLKRVGMGDVPLRRLCAELETLNRRRVQLARVLAAVPQLLVLIEPLRRLDALGQALILDLLKDLRERHGVAFLLVTADFRVAQALAENALVIRARKLIEKGPIEELLRAPREDYTKALVDAAYVRKV
jgi:ABC-type glutathione transport system ATPase component